MSTTARPTDGRRPPASSPAGGRSRARAFRRPGSSTARSPPRGTARSRPGPGPRAGPRVRVPWRQVWSLRGGAVAPRRGRRGGAGRRTHLVVGPATWPSRNIGDRATRVPQTHSLWSNPLNIEISLGKCWQEHRKWAYCSYRRIRPRRNTAGAKERGTRNLPPNASPPAPSRCWRLVALAPPRRCEPRPSGRGSHFFPPRAGAPRSPTPTAPRGGARRPPPPDGPATVDAPPWPRRPVARPGRLVPWPTRLHPPPTCPNETARG
jgi:hypothetical protein